jgi:hypothetical protein
MAHTVSGKQGIEIKRVGKKRTLLIGTQKPDEVRQILEVSLRLGSLPVDRQRVPKESLQPN